MPQRKLQRKAPRVAAQKRKHLRLVKPPRRKRLKIGKVWRPKYENPIRVNLHLYEEELILRVLRELRDAEPPVAAVSVSSLMWRYPERFNQQALWWTLLRLANKDELLTTRGLHMTGKIWQWWTHKRVQSLRQFWLKPNTELRWPHGR